MSLITNTAELPASNIGTPTQILDVGTSYTQLKGFSGEGYNISAKVIILEGLISKDKEILVNFYGKFYYLT